MIKFKWPKLDLRQRESPRSRIMLNKRWNKLSLSKSSLGKDYEQQPCHKELSGVAQVTEPPRPLVLSVRWESNHMELLSLPRGVNGMMHMEVGLVLSRGSIPISSQYSYCMPLQTCWGMVWITNQKRENWEREGEGIFSGCLKGEG